MNTDKEIAIDIQALIGKNLIKLQQLEFLMHGLISLFRSLPKYRRFKGFSGEIFLSDDPDHKKLRRQTLGQILEVIKNELELSYNQDLDIFLKKRNLFVHEFWREFIAFHKYCRKDATKFLSDLENETDEWLKVFKGLLSLMRKSIINRLPQEQVDELLLNGSLGNMTDFTKFEGNFKSKFVTKKLTS